VAARLGEKKALEIKQMIASGRHGSFSEIARLAEASVATVSRIASGKQWADLALVDNRAAAPASYAARLRERLGARREGQRRSRLTSQQVREIKQRLLAGETYRAIAPDYCVDFSYVGRIARGEYWSHVAPWEGAHPGLLRRQRRLTADEVSAIRSRRSESASALAEEFRVNERTVRDIRSRRTWKSDRPAAAKLSAATSRELRDRLERGERPAELAAEYGISRTTLWRVQTGRSWR
jgi:DNA invertase Pin-like site-specific DNA recombinase